LGALRAWPQRDPGVEQCSSSATEKYFESPGHGKGGDQQAEEHAEDQRVGDADNGSFQLRFLANSFSTSGTRSAKWRRSATNFSIACACVYSPSAWASISVQNREYHTARTSTFAFLFVMEVFICFTKDDDFTLLQRTLERWDACTNVHLAAIQCDAKKFEIARRVAADKMAKCDYYILADLGCVLDSWNALDGIEERLNGMEEGLIGLEYVGGKTCLPQEFLYPTGVRICRKNAVEKWLPKSTDTYDQEHVESVKLAGGTVGLCPDIFYKKLLAASH